MIKVSETSDRYLPSSLLSKRIGQYNENLQTLLPYLKENTVLSEISTERPFKSSLKEICNLIEPTVISVRSSGSKEATAAKNAIMLGLNQQHYIPLEVNDLIQLEVQRQTDIGKIIQDLLNAGKNIWSEPSLIVSSLKKIIYSGVDTHDKFLLVGFPD
jgi:adenylate kinase family enzyme